MREEKEEGGPVEGIYEVLAGPGANTTWKLPPLWNN
jgi:hypothetical protein